MLHIVYMYLSTCTILVCVMILQPESQKVLSHSMLTASYPRFPDVFDAMRDYTQGERSMLMVTL